MRITGTLIKDNRIIDSVTITCQDDSLSFRELLTEGLLEICHTLKITIPIWMNKNTKQIAAIGKVIFDKDQFMDETHIRFDKFEVAVD